MRGWIRAGIVSALVALGACQHAPPPQVPVVPTAVQKHAQATRYAIDPLSSTITLRIYRDGPLARFGHNHIIVATQIEGVVYREKDLTQSEVELRFPVAGMIVDSPDDRAKAGPDFPGVLPPEAIAGTRRHMLGPQLLAAEQYPHIALHSVTVSGQWPDLQMLVDVTVRNFTSRFTLPVHMIEDQQRLIAEGTVKLSQVQLGLQPYSVLGGGLRVGDVIDAEFHLVALREP